MVDGGRKGKNLLLRVLQDTKSGGKAGKMRACLYEASFIILLWMALRTAQLAFGRGLPLISHTVPTKTTNQ
jgi:hypothetical protein